MASELERSNQELEQFAYVASHDLKSPLRGINNLSRGIEEDLEGTLKGETKENMSLLRRGVTQLTTLLDDLLSYSKVGQKMGDTVLVNSKEIINDIVHLVGSKDLYLKVKLHPDLPTFITTKSALELVFRNLISNTIKHHDRNVINIYISAERNNGYYRFSVKDDGPGIDPKYHERIFEMFKTIRLRDEVEGSGIGLAIVKKLIAHQGGKIRVESQTGEQGTNFIFDWKIEQ